MAKISASNTRAHMVIPKALKADIAELSKKSGVTFSAVARIALESHVAMKKAQSQ